MKEIIGEYGTAKVFTDMVEDEALEQVKALMDCAYISGQRVRMMPDIHAGAGCTIGTTIKLKNKAVCPNLVGVDIGCGMLATYVNERFTNDMLKQLDELIYSEIPSGFNVRKYPHTRMMDFPFRDFRAPINKDYAMTSCGTLGGGNHFIEVDWDERNKQNAIVIHSGSRHLGVEIAEYYQKKAVEWCRKNAEDCRKQIISDLKAAGLEKEIGGALRNARTKWTLPDALCYLTDDLYDDYMNDMYIAQRYASWNREIMRDLIIVGLDLTPDFNIESVHNYIDMNDMVLRKGATSAIKGQHLLIPINMRDGTLICKGKGNDDWNCSAPHGAGRLLGRRQARQVLSMDDFRQSMEGIYTTSISKDTLDESPMAYKPIQNILDNIGDTAEVVTVIKPVYNFKAKGGE